MKKRLVGFLIAVTVCGMLAGCGNKEASLAEADSFEEVPEVVEEEVKEEESTPAVAEDAGEEPDHGHEIVAVGNDSAVMRIGMVTDAGGINDHSFNESAWQGLQFLNENMGARVCYLEADSPDEYYGHLERLVEDKNAVCWGVGYQFAEPLLKIAEENPNEHFAIVDYAYEEIPSNVTCVTFRAEESAYLVGYIAATVSQTGKIGFVGGQDIEPIHAFKAGYEAGAAMADKDNSVKTEIVSVYLSSFESEAQGKEAAEKLYDEGCDIVFHAAGGSGLGVIEAAKEKNKFVIGADADQSYLAPDNVLTSAMKMVNVPTTNVSMQYLMDDNIGGKNIEYGLAEHAVGIPESHPNYPDELYDRVMQLRNRIINGEIKIPKE